MSYYSGVIVSMLLSNMSKSKHVAGPFIFPFDEGVISSRSLSACIIVFVKCRRVLSSIYSSLGGIKIVFAPPSLEEITTSISVGSIWKPAASAKGPQILAIAAAWTSSLVAGIFKDLFCMSLCKRECNTKTILCQ